MKAEMVVVFICRNERGVLKSPCGSCLCVFWEAEADIDDTLWRLKPFLWKYVIPC